MNIVIAGAGNVATFFGQKLKAEGHHIKQVFSRNISHAEQLAQSVEARAINDINLINKKADVYLLAVSDTALSELNDQLKLGQQLVLHTSGAMPLAVINKISKNTGVLYPLQTIKREFPNSFPVRLLLEASSEEALSSVKMIANSISDQYYIMNSEKRLRLHLAAVMGNNFMNHLAALIARYCDEENVDFDLLKPLFEETFYRFKNNQPEEIQTGPAIRQDHQTLSKHQALLKEQPQLLAIYNILTESIQAFYA